MNNNRVTKKCEGKYCKIKYGKTVILEDVHPRRQFCNFCSIKREYYYKRGMSETEALKHYSLKLRQGRRRLPIKINTGAGENAWFQKCRRISLANNQMDE